jgi:hypothetical protein
MMMMMMGEWTECETHGEVSVSTRKGRVNEAVDRTKDRRESELMMRTIDKRVMMRDEGEGKQQENELVSVWMITS